jgi:general secretion pathway protein G
MRAARTRTIGLIFEGPLSMLRSLFHQLSTQVPLIDQSSVEPFHRRRNDHQETAHEANDAGFTLLELLVVLGIIVLIATIAAPQVLRYLGKARTETARAQVSALSTALELYALDNGGFPNQQTGLNALVTAPSAAATRWRGPYIKRASGLVDPWGRPYGYRFPGRANQPDVYTLGRDNTVGGADEDQDVAN